jgi:hypothetical protein
MGLDFYISIGCIVSLIVFGLWLASYNLKVLRETKEERLRIRRAYKKAKNERLKRFLRIKDISEK